MREDGALGRPEGSAPIFGIRSSCRGGEAVRLCPMTPPDLPAEAEELLRGPPSEFVAARNALAARLRAAGDEDSAAAVAAMRKPGLSAWTVNRLAAERPALLGELRAVNARLREAQRAVVAGSRSAELHEAMRERHRIVRDAVGAAAEILGTAGHSAGASTLDRVAASLYATAADSDGEGRVLRGALVEDLVAPEGFGDFAPAAGTAPAGGEEGPSAQERRLSEEAERTAREAERLVAEAERAEAEAERLSRRTVEVREEAERLASRAAAAAGDARAARADAEAAAAEAARARKRAARAGR